MRIAEFASAQDAMAFCRTKGDKYTVCPGMNLLYAVRTKEHHELCEDVFCEECADIRYTPIPGTLGLGVEPTDYKPAPYRDPDEE
jgi:hypothetical protein